MEELFKAFGASVSNNELKLKLKKSEEMVFLGKLSNGGGLNVFHHFSQIGNTLYSNTNSESGFIIGLYRETATPMMPDIEVLLAKQSATKIAVLKRNEICNCVLIKDIEDLKDSTTQSYNPRSFVPVPPFLVRSIDKTMKRHKGEPFQILLTTIKEAKGFDHAHKDDGDYVDKAELKCRQLFSRLYLAGKNDDDMKQISIQICTDTAMANHFKEIKEKI